MDRGRAFARVSDFGELLTGDCGPILLKIYYRATMSANEPGKIEIKSDDRCFGRDRSQATIAKPKSGVRFGSHKRLRGLTYFDGGIYQPAQIHTQIDSSIGGCLIDEVVRFTEDMRRRYKPLGEFQ
jgi:hypothetical protein